MILWLIGMMGTGKSTAGKRAAQLVGVDFFDTDDIVESSAGMTIGEIWARSGEAGFRKLEAEALREVAVGGEGLVATGGGVVSSDDNRVLMTSTGRVIWLTASPEVAMLRIRELTSRPLLSGEIGSPSYDEILDRRQFQYESIADYVIDTDDKELDQVASAVVALWQP